MSLLPAEPGDVVHHQEVARKPQLRNDSQLVLDLRVGPRRALRRAVAVARARHDQLPQPAVLGVPVGHVERRQLRGDQRQPERALLAEFGGGRHRLPGSARTAAPSPRRTAGANHPAGPANRRPRPATAGPGSRPSPWPAGRATARRSARRWWRPRRRRTAAPARPARRCVRRRADARDGSARR